MLNAFSGVFNLLLLSALGYLLHRIEFMNDDNIKFITKFTTKVVIPCMLLLNAYQNLNWTFLRRTGLWLLFPLLLSVILYFLARILGKIIRVPQNKSGVFCALMSMPNTISIGLPIAMAVLGEEALPYVMAFYLSTAVLFWTFVAGRIAADANVVPAGWKERIKRMVSLPLVAMLAGMIFGLIGITIPDFLQSALSAIGVMNTPLTLLITGSILSQMGSKAFQLKKEGVAILGGRFIFSPVICFLLCRILAAPNVMTHAYVVESALPCMNQVMLMSKFYGADEQLAAQMIAVSSVLSLIVIPIIVYVLG